MGIYLHAGITQLCPSYLPPLLSSAGRFTDLPSNMTVKEGQNIEMACAFQSGTASVYLEIQWWFVKAPEPTDSEEDVNAEEVQGAFFFLFPSSLFLFSPIKSYVLSTPTHKGNKGHPSVRAITHKRLMSSASCACSSPGENVRYS